MTPSLQKGVRDYMRQVVYVVKHKGATRRLYPYYLMTELFPNHEPIIFNEAWAARVREMSRSQQMPKPDNTGQGKTSLAAVLPKYTGWDYDPWDKMHLWDREHDYFSAAQYCPCL
jgi:hypothetical protein